MTASATGADARRERGKMPAAASDPVSNDADAPVPPPRFVVYPADCTATTLALDRTLNMARQCVCAWTLLCLLWGLIVSAAHGAPTPGQPSPGSALPASPAVPPGDVAGAATQAIVAFDAANKLYEQAKFAEAARAYHQILDGGKRSVDLYFNLGNAWFKAGRTGRAIAAYRQAERLSPREPSVQFNLAFARKQVTSGEPPARPLVERLVSGLTLDEWSLVAAGSFWLAFALLAVGELRASFRPTARRYALVAALAAAACTGAALVYRAVQDGNAVIVVSEAVVRSGPLDEAKVLHQFRDGTEVDILDRKQLSNDQGQTWFHVRNANAATQAGWIKEDQLIRILP